MRMNDIERALFLSMVRNQVAQDGTLARDVIEAATEGIKDFADKQSETGTKAAFRLMCVMQAIEPPSLDKLGCFTVEQVLQGLESSFGGTPAMKGLYGKFGVEPSTKEVSDAVA